MQKCPVRFWDTDITLSGDIYARPGPSGILMITRMVCMGRRLAPLGIGFDTYQPYASDLEDKLTDEVKRIWMESPGPTTLEVPDVSRLLPVPGREEY